MRKKELLPKAFRNLLSAFSLSILSAAFGMNVFAQSSGDAAENNANEDELMEEVTVTGSFIRRKNQADLASPITIIGGEDLENVGATSLYDVIPTLTINQGAQIYSDSTEQARSAGATNINLRGLGVSSTLVLVNSRRQTMSPAVTEDGDQFVDLSTLLPEIAIERVEVLKDGASSLYGSDAVAGVVNFITRSRFEGAELSAIYKNNKHGYDEYSVGGIFGAGNENGHIMVAINYLDRSALPVSKMRDFYPGGNQDSWSGYGLPGKVIAFDVAGPPIKVIDPLCTSGEAYTRWPEYQRPKGGPFADGSCQMNYSYFGDIVASTKQTQGFAQGSYNIGESTEAFIEIGFGRNETVIHTTPTQPLLDPLDMSDSHPDIITVAGENAFADSFGGRGTLFARPLGAGSPPGNSPLGYRAWRYQLGFRGDFGNDWQWEAAWTNSINETNMERTDTVTANMQLALDGFGPGSNPAGQNYYHWLYSAQDQNTPEMMDFVLGTFGYDAKASLTVIDAHITGNLMELKAGALGAAFGVEYRKNKLSYDFNEKSNEYAFNFFGGGDDFRASGDVKAIFAEFLVPVTSSFDLEASVRYSDLGSEHSTDPKFSALWRPMDQLSLRASWGTSFRIATLFQQYSTFVTPQSANDPLFGGEEVSFITLLTGDSDNPLVPQEADAINLGLTWTADSGFQASLDYWNFDYKNYITAEAPQTLLDTEPPGGSDQIIRGPGGEVTKIIAFFRNAGSLKTDGIDWGLSYTFDTGSAGHLTAQWNGTYVLSYDLDDPVIGHIDGLGNVNDENFGASMIEHKSYLGLLWGLGNHSANIFVRYFGPYHNDNDDNAKVKSWTTVDGQYSYLLPAIATQKIGATLTVGVNNLFDEAAPAVYNSVGYDATQHDPRGRTFYVGVTYPF
jgi:iron complex outermembrane receptor protein